RYFYESDIKEFEAYKDQLDDQIKAYDIAFFNLTHERLLKRIAESKELYKEVLSQPFDFNIKEESSTDYEILTYVKSKNEMKERWRQQLKFSTIANYDDLISQNEKIEKGETKAPIEFEKEARESTLSSLDELYDFID